jgi:hypothetical protein
MRKRSDKHKTRTKRKEFWIEAFFEGVVEFFFGALEFLLGALFKAFRD